MRAGLAALVLVISCLPPQYQQPQPQPGAADDTVVACAGFCEKALACKGAADDNGFEGCVGECMRMGPDPQALRQATTLECAQINAALGGGAQPAALPPAATGAARADLAGVWVGEESSLDPQFYMSYTQYITLYPDGSVGWSKSEGGASRTRIDESSVRFRSWREGQTAANIYGRWQSDGAQVSIQWRGRQNPSVGPVQGNKMRLSGMGVLTEGAAVTFQRQ